MAIKIVESAKSAVNRFGFNVKKHSPTILLAVGIAGVVGGAVAACVATTKASKVLEARKEQLKSVDIVLNDENKTEDYTEDNARSDRKIINIQSGAKLIMLYAPAVAIEFGGIACILASYGIMRKRNAALAAAYAAVNTGFMDYRKRVAGKLGTDAERDVALNISDDSGNGEETEPGTEKKTGVVSKDLGGSPYAMIFDATTSKAWEKDEEYNIMYLRAEQQYATDRLRARGYLYLNEVLERLGIDGNKMGQIVCWVYDPENPDYDNFVDFGIREFENEDGETKIILDFNVQGNILDLM